MENFESLYTKVSNLINNTKGDYAFFEVNDNFSYDIDFPTPVNNLSKPFEIKLVNWIGSEVQGGKSVMVLNHDKLDQLFNTFMHQTYNYMKGLQSVD